MSVIVKGMEMPKNCERCPFLDYEQGFCFASGEKGENGWYEFSLWVGGDKTNRHANCPLVEIPSPQEPKPFVLSVETYGKPTSTLSKTD